MPLLAHHLAELPRHLSLVWPSGCQIATRLSRHTHLQAEMLPLLQLNQQVRQIERSKRTDGAKCCNQGKLGSMSTCISQGSQSSQQHAHRCECGLAMQFHSLLRVYSHNKASGSELKCVLIATCAAKKAAVNGPSKAASKHVSKAGIAAAAAPVAVQASAHVNSNYTAAPAYPVHAPIQAASLSERSFHHDECSAISLLDTLLGSMFSLIAAMLPYVLVHLR